jgi:hypothetical protein
MELVKEMPEPQIVEQEIVQVPLPQIIQMLFAVPTKLVVSPQVKAVCPPEVHVQVIRVLIQVVWDLLDQTDIVKELPLQAHHVPPRYVLKLLLLHPQMPPVPHIKSVVSLLEKAVQTP